MNENQSYQEIDILGIIKAVLRRWWLIALLMILAGGVTYYVTTTYVTPMYQAESTLFIGKESDVSSSISMSDLNIDSELVVDYRELIKTRLVTTEVKNELALTTPEKDIVDNLGIEVVADSRFVHVTFQDPIPERATKIVNSLSVVLADKATEIVGMDNIRVVDEALVPTQPVSPNVIVNVALAMILGALIGLIIIFTEMMLDNTMKTEEDVEKYLELPVLGVIPEFKGEVRR